MLVLLHIYIYIYICIHVYISIYMCVYIYIHSTNIPSIRIINWISETQNLLSLYLVSFLVGLRTYQRPCRIICNSKIEKNTGDR